MKKAKIDTCEGIRVAGKTPARFNGLEAVRKWIPCEEFCELYRLPITRPPRKTLAKYSTSKATAARKCCERLAAKGLIKTHRIDGRLYVAMESVRSFGEKA